MILKNAFLNALGTALYVGAVGAFLYYAPQLIKPGNNVLINIAMLLLFVFSAAITGSLIFGRPVLWYLDGRRREALTLLFYTLGFLLGFTAVAFLGLLLNLAK